MTKETQSYILLNADMQAWSEEIKCVFTWVVGAGGHGSAESVSFRQREGRRR